MHLLPVPQGLSTQVATLAPNAEMALDHSSGGSKIEVFVMRTLSVELIRRAAPRGASLARNTLSRMMMLLEPAAVTAPPRPVLTRNGVLDQKTSCGGQQVGPSHKVAPLHPGYRSLR